MFSQRTGFTSRYRGVVSRMGPSAWEKRGGRDTRLFVSPTFDRTVQSAFQHAHIKKLRSNRCGRAMDYMAPLL